MFYAETLMSAHGILAVRLRVSSPYQIMYHSDVIH